MPSWVQFLREIQRIEFRWFLEPAAGGTLKLQVYDHRPDGGLAAEVKGAGSLCQPIADMFNCCASLSSNNVSECEARFADLGREHVMRFKALKRIGEVEEEPPIVTCMTRSGSKTVDLEISLVDKRTNANTVLFESISLLAVNNAFLSSLPPFLKRNDIGVRNYDFLVKDQVEAFRFGWVTLRRESYLTPIEVGELDLLLPS
ncbi:hypothetical protein AGDE_01696 [Angomonas deanei]|uniref:Uncharacterized protein n=1 Tax=Angomonas deanei TaxID=59799 RepID=S9VHH8_9TRYP|nr:hypothetical protein AGDE_04626 [Angomonas deanei]EPY42227.1 hypothetical protein AGDE_01696 [Angomonas deanei]CAD2218234.1 hypothetical protein, conserved [Angomonas deanei]|eukprot:EPY39302.1 hypothetical protein AGDE_04626 [Angomonas deanei]